MISQIFIPLMATILFMKFDIQQIIIKLIKADFAFE